MVPTPSVAFTGILILFFMSLLEPTLPQPTPAGPSVPTVAQCGPRLIPLASCAPFVQGRALLPTEQCCNNLKQSYDQQRACLCLFLNGTGLASLPINTTLALQLPALCSPQIDLSTCSFQVPESPPSQFSSKRKPGTPAAAAPAVTVAPRPSTARFGMGKSLGYKLRSQDQLGVSVAVLTLLLAKLI